MGTFRYTRAARFYSRMHLTFLCLLAGHRDIRCVVMISKLSQTDHWIAIQFSRTSGCFSPPPFPLVFAWKIAPILTVKRNRERGSITALFQFNLRYFLTLRITRWIYELEFEMETNYFFVMKIVTNCFGIRRAWNIPSIFHDRSMFVVIISNSQPNS